MSYTDRRSAPDGFGPHYVAWDYRPVPTKATPCPEPDPSPIVPTSSPPCSVLPDLDWFHRVGPTVVGHSLPLEWVPPSTAHDDDGMNEAHRRYGKIGTRIRLVAALPNGPLLVWILRAWHGGSAGLDRAAGAAESYDALLLGASDEEHERRILTARAREAACRDEVKRLTAIVHPPVAASKDEPKGKRRGRKRRRNVAAESVGRAAITDVELELRIAKRHVAEAREVVRVQVENAAARALAEPRAEWAALDDDAKRRRMSGLHDEAIAAYEEAGR